MSLDNLPMGTTFGSRERELAGIANLGTAIPEAAGMARLRQARALLLSGRCIDGTLDCCEHCSVKSIGDECPVATIEQERVVGHVLLGQYPPGPSEKTVLINYLDPHKRNSVD